MSTGAPKLVMLAMLAALAGAVAADAGAPDPALAEARRLLEQGRTEQARAAFRALAASGDAHAQDVLAAMVLEGVGGPADRPGAMGWYCMLAHQPAGGRPVVRALWVLAEYYRTGGGLPGRRYNQGRPDREDPVRAYFWFRLMADQAAHYEQVLEDGVRLGRLGSREVARQLYEGERQQVDRRLERWSPTPAPERPETCLELPRN